MRFDIIGSNPQSRFELGNCVRQLSGYLRELGSQVIVRPGAFWTGVHGAGPQTARILPIEIGQKFAPRRLDMPRPTRPKPPAGQPPPQGAALSH